LSSVSTIGTPLFSHAEIVGGIHLRAGAYQAFGRGDVVPVRGPMQRRGAVRLRGIDVDPLLEQRVGRTRVAAFHRLHQPQVRTRLRRDRGADERGKTKRDQALAEVHLATPYGVGS
jgi:hypothetical protein